MTPKLALGLLIVLGVGDVVTSQRLPEFDVSSIRRRAGAEAGGTVLRRPDGTFIATNISIRNLLGHAWPSDDFEYRNLPGWAVTNRYDVTVKPPAGASAAEIKEMWRGLFKERFKLEAHDEMRDTPIYVLVLARSDGTLGPQLRRSPHDCAALAAAPAAPPAPPRTAPPSEAEVMGSCGSLFQQGRILLGGTLLSTFARSLSGGLVGRLVEDRTGLEGYFALTLTYAQSPRTGAEVPETPGEAPSIFTALQEQLGLKLQPARKPVQTVVIDRIEAPTEN